VPRPLGSTGILRPGTSDIGAVSSSMPLRHEAVISSGRPIYRTGTGFAGAKLSEILRLRLRCSLRSGLTVNAERGGKSAINPGHWTGGGAREGFLLISDLESS
jgi:hypothetical protein